jgi:hypothetical protein
MSESFWFKAVNFQGDRTTLQLQRATYTGYVFSVGKVCRCIALI